MRTGLPDTFSSGFNRASVALTAAVLTAALILRGLLPGSMTIPGVGAVRSFSSPGLTVLAAEAMKLAAAALIGMVVTLVQRRTRIEKPLSWSMEQTQVLLAVAGALTITVIGDSLPRAFAIAGAASIIRFRTPVDDPRDITILFLLMGLGMATGLGAHGVAAVGTLFVCVCLWILRHGAPVPTRSLSVHVVAKGPDFPTECVTKAFADHGVSVEPVEVSRDEANASVRYRASLNASTSLDDLSAQLINTRIKSVVWQAPKKDR